MERSELKRTILKISEGVLANATDFLLWWFFMATTPSFSGKTSRSVWRAASQADKALEEINYEVFKNTLYFLKRKGLLKFIKEELLLKPFITEQGRKRLKSLLPVYDSGRVWDGRVYTIAYDIPEEERRSRDLLREFLKKIKAAKLQESLYLTVYNPKQLLSEFVSDHHIFGWVLVSDLGRDGTVGGGTFN